jgi:hypothetical protein
VNGGAKKEKRKEKEKKEKRNPGEPRSVGFHFIFEFFCLVFFFRERQRERELGGVCLVVAKGKLFTGRLSWGLIGRVCFCWEIRWVVDFFAFQGLSGVN